MVASSISLNIFHTRSVGSDIIGSLRIAWKARCLSLDSYARSRYASIICTLLELPIRWAPASIIFRQVSRSLIPPEALTLIASPTMSFISLTSSYVAPDVPKPVEVLMKSGLTLNAILHSSLI